MRIGFSHDGKMMALSVGRCEVALFNAATLIPLATFEAPEAIPVSGIAFSPDGTQLAVSTQGQEIRLWNLPAIRRQLAAINLDYDGPQLSPSTNVNGRVKITVAGLAPATLKSSIPMP